MELNRLTIKEIELRISKFTERSETLLGAANDISDDRAKTSLQQHVNRYRMLLQDLRKELEDRGRETAY